VRRVVKVYEFSERRAPTAPEPTRLLAFSRLAQTLLYARVVESELGRLLLQVIGVIVMTIAIGLLLPFARGSGDDESDSEDRPDRVVPRR
jgi:hypothetical protein